MSAKRLAVGVSGGRDSMCLLHAVVNCGEVSRANVTAVHVNHHLRDEADSDMLFVKRFCEDNGIAFSAHSVDVKKTAVGQSVELTARQLRYDIFYSLLNSGYDAVLTAHHALDNAESVLMHMFRGAGLDGLRGMSGVDRTGKILRPLLTVHPNELDEYAGANGIHYVQDSTNLLDDADRNFIRLNVIPLIEKRYSGVVRAVNALSSECGDACDELDSRLDMSLIKRDGGAVKVFSAALDSDLCYRYIRAAIKYFSLTDVTRVQVERVAGLKDKRVGAKIELSNGTTAAREYDGIVLYVERYKYEGSIVLHKGANILDGLKIDVTPISLDNVELKSTHGNIADFRKLDGAEIRFRRDGDIFTPFNGREKKLKEYLITEKVPSRLRDRIPLICRGDEVLVIVGYQISDKVRVTADTTDAVAIECSRDN
ncbi:MAG: tRNA lysidine(34) synthetase TilS [Clostridiales bacterium]|nr:tRNA lysidine(34) synthetase TilS [Clostridiales bacterium]